MSRIPRAFLHGLLFAAVPAFAAGLPDTGQDTCYNDTAADAAAASDAASIARDAGTHPRQDCRYGRDAAALAGQLGKAGAGSKGLDYTKIANSGAALGAGASLGAAAGDWACTRDNVTGLVWEVKITVPTSPRYHGHRFSWYDSNPATNAGNAGVTGSNTCSATLPGSLCNTAAFVTAVNAMALCGFADWRLPTTRELLTIVLADRQNPAIDPAYFPNTPFDMGYWASWTYGEGSDLAWAVDFREGGNPTGFKARDLRHVRVVRGGPF